MLSRVRIGLGVPSGVPLSEALGGALIIEWRLGLGVGLVGGLTATLIKLFTGGVFPRPRRRQNQGTSRSSAGPQSKGTSPDVCVTKLLRIMRHDRRQPFEPWPTK